MESKLDKEWMKGLREKFSYKKIISQKEAGS